MQLPSLCEIRCGVETENPVVSTLLTRIQPRWNCYVDPPEIFCFTHYVLVGLKLETQSVTAPGQSEPSCHNTSLIKCPCINPSSAMASDLPPPRPSSVSRSTTTVVICATAAVLGHSVMYGDTVSCTVYLSPTPRLFAFLYNPSPSKPTTVSSRPRCKFDHSDTRGRIACPIIRSRPKPQRDYKKSLCTLQEIILQFTPP